MLRINIYFFITAGLSLLRNPNHGQGGAAPATKNLPAVGARQCQVYDENQTTCTFEANTRRTDSNVAVMRAWTAVILRENVLSTLGYMLYKANNTLPRDTYTSLYLLYREVQRQNVRMMELVPRLRNIAQNKRVPLVVSLLKSLHGVTPAYLKSVLNELVKEFMRHREVARSLMPMAAIDSKGYDLFSNIDKRLLPLMRYKNATKVRNRSIEGAFGKEFAKFYIGIYEGRIALTQAVLGLLMQNMRWSTLLPDEVEDFHFLVDNLRNSNLTGWKPNPQGFVPCCYGATGPYALVSSCLSTIQDAPEVDERVKNIVENLLPKLAEPSNEVVNSYYKYMEPFLGRQSFDVDLLFDKLRAELGLSEVTELKQSMRDGIVNIQIVAEGFNKYIFEKPQDLMLAFVKRIMNRAVLPTNETFMINKIYTELRQKHLARSQRRSLDSQPAKRNVSDLTIIDFEQPTLRNLVRNIVNWRQIFHPLICKDGSTCSSEMADMIASADMSDVLRRARANLMICEDDQSLFSLSLWTKQLDNPAWIVSSELVQDVSDILAKVFKDTEIMNEVVHVEESSLVDDNNYYRPSARTHGTRRDKLHRILKTMLIVKRVQARPLVFHEVIRLLCVLIPNCTDESLSKLADLWLDRPPPRGSLEHFFRGVNQRLAQLFRRQQFAGVLSGIEPEDYSTNRMLLMAMFRRILPLDSARNNEQIFNEIVRLVHAIHDPAVNFTGLLKTLIVDDARAVLLVSATLSYPSLFYNLNPDFNVGLYRTDGNILKAILKKIVNSTYSTNQSALRGTMKKLLARIDCSENYVDVVRSIEKSIVTDAVNFNKVLKGSLVKTVSSDVTEALQRMSKWNQIVFDPAHYIREMNLSVYDTRAEFMAGFYATVFRSIDTNVAMLRRDIKVLSDAVIKTRGGAAPVDYGFP